MIKKQIYFTERQWKVLSERAKKIGISLAEMIRRILDDYLDKENENNKVKRTKKSN